MSGSPLSGSPYNAVRHTFKSYCDRKANNAKTLLSDSHILTTQYEYDKKKSHRYGYVDTLRSDLKRIGKTVEEKKDPITSRRYGQRPQKKR